jgi:NADH-quinone oxidoreductase subunit C
VSGSLSDVSVIVEALRRAVSGVVVEIGDATDMPTMFVDRDHLVGVLRVLRDDPALQFSALVDVTSTDGWPAEPRFTVVYHLVCLGESYRTADVAAPARRLRVKVRVPGDDPRVPSAVPVHAGANWPEREVYDLMGIAFDGHPDLRRILTPEDWSGYPLRKDYPVQVRKETEAWSPLQLTPEEFAANIREARARADRASGRS